MDTYGRLSEQDDDEEGKQAALMPTDPGSKAVDPEDAEPRTLYVSRKVLNAADVIKWAKGQGFETTLPEDDLHVTIAFSRTPVDWMKVGENWAGSDRNGNLEIAPGGARMVERFDGGAVVLMFASSELSWRHEIIKERGASWDWPEYQPHITISYSGPADLRQVDPYKGRILLGPEVFAEVNEDWISGVTEE